ncbi:MAG TPA: S-layer homology domain-containing protein, partial [bacterium]|nr:S-layer homology domain-containing protein [bacterium]
MPSPSGPSPIRLSLLLVVTAALLGTSGRAALGQTSASDIGGHWAEARINDLLGRAIIGLGAERSFRPNEPISRAQFIAWLVAARGLPPSRSAAPAFVDLPVAHESATAIETAVTFGIVPGGGAFRPGAPIARGDALVFLVRSLGYTFEAAYMTNAPLSFLDADGLPPVVRGAAAIAALSSPPMLREPSIDRLRADDPMTRAEAASLIWAYVQGLERGVALRFSTTLGPGVTLVLEKRGALKILPVWRVQAGVFQEEERARRLADAIRARGQPVFVDPIDDGFRVRVGNFTTREDAIAFQQRLAGEGLTTVIILTVRDYEGLQGPFWTGMIVIEPNAGVRLRPVLAREAIGRGRTSEAARRAGALAAINGGFFSTVGDPLGCLVVDGEVLSEPIPGRTCAGITEDGELLFDVPRFEAGVASEAGTIAVQGINRERGADETIIYRTAYGPSTRTNPWGAEVSVTGDTVQQVIDGQGNSPIPPGGFIVSGHGRSRSALLTAFKPGDRLTAWTRLLPASGDQRWETVRYVLGGGPRLLANGVYVGGEGFRPSFVDRRHPRTAIGRLPDGRIVL